MSASPARAQSGTHRTVHVVTTCTDRKTLPPAVRAGTLAARGLQARVTAWQGLLTSGAEDAVPASRLYAGDHWQVAKTLHDEAPPEVRIRVWVCSAGYGLIEPSTQVRPYAATFDAAHPDAVAPREATFSAAAWWEALTAWELGNQSSVRSIAALAEYAQPSCDIVLVAVSGQYLAAVRSDASAAAGILGNRLILLSAGTRAEHLHTIGAGQTLASHLLPADARLKALVGGAMQSLNVRLARQAVRHANEWVAQPQVLHQLFARWSAEAPAPASFDRDRTDDATLRAFMREALRRDVRASHTNLLRTLRASGRACEQSRFRALFREVRDEMELPALHATRRGRPV